MVHFGMLSSNLAMFTNHGSLRMGIEAPDLMHHRASTSNNETSLQNAPPIHNSDRDPRKLSYNNF